MSRLSFAELPATIGGGIVAGLAIPAHPLALNAARELDERRQRALTRYYLDAGAGGLAVGVHTTQFAIRDCGLYEPVLRLAAETARDWVDRPVAMIAGVAGRTEQAMREADIAIGLGYHAALVSPTPFRNASEDALLNHCRALAKVIPLVGFYLQPAVGGRVLSTQFWRRFAEIESVVAIKIAPFNRYGTLAVVHGVVEARAEERVALYTGNDDHIVGDLLTPFVVRRGGEEVKIRIVGGLLGHWSVWTKVAVDLHARCRAVDGPIPADLLALDSQVTDMNSAIFDVANGFNGVIAGCHEVLRRNGLLEGIWCLDPDEGLSPGQGEEISRVAAAYPHLTDDDFVRANHERWLA
jgi:hypothetical protein